MSRLVSTCGLITLLATACGSAEHAADTRPNAFLVVEGVSDLTTNVSTAARIGWVTEVPPDRPLSEDQMIDALRRAIQVLEWPAGTPAAGRFDVVRGEGRDDLSASPRLEWVRDPFGPRGWEALVIDYHAFPAEFQTYLPQAADSRGVLRVRYSTESGPIITEAFLRPVTPDSLLLDGTQELRFTPEYLVGVSFSEPLQTGSLLDAGIQVNVEGGPSGCLRLENGPGDPTASVALFYCPAIPSTARVTLTIDSALATSEGVTLSDAYGRSPSLPLVVEIAPGTDTERRASAHDLEVLAGIAAGTME